MKNTKAKAKAVLGVCLCLIGNGFARIANADPSAADKSVATQLFGEGRALLEQGRLDQACPKLEESQRIDPGGGTLLNVALCHERQGRTATAWVEFIEARGIAKADNRPVRVAFAQAHISALEPTLSRIVLQVPNGADEPDLEVRRDGNVIARAAWGSALPVDPGDHVFEAQAPGKRPWSEAIVVVPSGETRTILVPALQALSVVPSVAIATSPPAPAETPVAVAPPVAEPTILPKSPDSRARGGSAGLSAAGWIALGLGVAGAGVSTYFGLHAIALKNDADRECSADACTSQGASTNHDAIRSADISTATAAAGVVGLGLGATLLIVAATKRPERTMGPIGQSSPAPGASLVGWDVGAGPGRGGLTVLGRW